jgi:hypothetical protein
LKRNNNKRVYKMINTIKANEFINGIMSIRPDNFTADALSEMFDWFEQYEDEMG